MTQRNIFEDVLVPLTRGLTHGEKVRIGIALDAAIAFGALGHAEGNIGVENLTRVEAKYWENVRKLKND